MDPITLAILGASGGLKMFGGFMEGFQGYQAGKYNARMARRAAEEVRISGEWDKARIDTEAGRAVSASRAATARAGVDVTQGSPLLAMLKSLDVAEQDKAMVRRRVGLTAWQHEIEARHAAFMGRQALMKGIMGGIGGGLGSLGDMAKGGAFK